MEALSVVDLKKTYRTVERRTGVRGALLDLIAPRYKELNAVDGISFTIQPGEIVGYIGENGAGKSTSIKIFTGILQPGSGEVRALGFDPFRQRSAYARRIGVVFGQRTQLWWDIAVKESFELLGRIYRVEREEFVRHRDMLIETMGIADVLSSPVRKLSLGQRMRCDLVASLLHKPEILFLDEPTIGLDAVAKDNIRGFLRRINRELGTTILLTTHDLPEIEELCRRVIILHQGKTVFDGALERIKSLPGLRRRLLIDFAHPLEPGDLLARLPQGVDVQPESSRRIVCSFDSDKTALVSLLRAVVDNFEVVDFTVEEPGIEQVVMKIYRDPETAALLGKGAG